MTIIRNLTSWWPGRGTRKDDGAPPDPASLAASPSPDLVDLSVTGTGTTPPGTLPAPATPSSGAGPAPAIGTTAPGAGPAGPPASAPAAGTPTDPSGDVLRAASTAEAGALPPSPLAGVAAEWGLHQTHVRLLERLCEFSSIDLLQRTLVPWIGDRYRVVSAEEAARYLEGQHKPLSADALGQAPLMVGPRYNAQVGVPLETLDDLADLIGVELGEWWPGARDPVLAGALNQIRRGVREVRLQTPATAYHLSKKTDSVTDVGSLFP